MKDFTIIYFEDSELKIAYIKCHPDELYIHLKDHFDKWNMVTKYIFEGKCKNISI